MDTAMTRTFNRKLKMRDTFTKIFPSYDHCPTTTYKMPSQTHYQFNYPEKNIDGQPIHQIDRTFTHKTDAMKYYNEEIIKVESIKR